MDKFSEQTEKTQLALQLVSEEYHTSQDGKAASLAEIVTKMLAGKPQRTRLTNQSGLVKRIIFISNYYVFEEMSNRTLLPWVQGQHLNICALTTS